MNLLLDTCVLSEFASKQPNEGLINWLEQQLEERLYISTITSGELKCGTERLPASQRRERLEQWLTSDVFERFSGRMLVIDTLVMLQWGALRAQLERAGRPMPAVDALIAATVLAHNMQLVTRNVQDFASAGVQLINPWQESNSSS